MSRTSSQSAPLAATAAACLCAAVLGVRGVAASAQPAPQDLKKLSLEQLMDIEVTLVTRQPEPVGTAAAAVSVITRDDIRRSGVTTIPDALALADGLDVARFNNGSWAITARGFNGSTPNKLLVMVDGRDEYTPLFAGVFWNILDYVLDDIERIEVIRGPGATLWGANAVNGVVNIITRHSRDTRGTLVSVGAGNEDPALVEVRQGGGSDKLSYRVYGKYAQRDAQQFSTGGSSGDTRRRGQAGVRLDGGNIADQWLLKADYFESRDGFPDRGDGEWQGIGVQGRLTHALSSSASLQLQAYYRREYRNIERQLTHYVDTGDLDFQHAFKPTPRNNFIWGAAFRANRDRTFGSDVVHFDPTRRSYPLFSAFAQNEIELRPRSLFVTAGLKVEHNAFNGADWQPNLRARQLLPHNQVVWGAVSRAVRRPTRFDDDIQVTTTTGLLVVRGNPNFESEVMTGWELGYRSRPIASLSFDVTGFVQNYDRLRSQEAPPTVIPLTIGNTLNGQSRGIELGATVQPAGWWRAQAGYTYFETSITRDAGSADVSGGVNEANDPHHLFNLRTVFDLARHVELDGWLRAVGALPNPAVPAYTELNARVGWKPIDRFEVALIGQDLLHAHHPEFGTSVPRRIEFERSVRAQVTIRVP